jgi:hypothetical protein
MEELGSGASSQATSSTSGRRWFESDLFGVAWVLTAAIAVLAPALSGGAGIYSFTSFGDRTFGAIPWTTLEWRMVHAGHLPLWNPFDALGMPLAFDFQTAAFSLPNIASYLVPLHLAYATQLIFTLIVAGTGVYAFGRVLGLGVIGCAFAATAFELGGPFLAYLGMSVCSTMSWTGWLFAAGLLIIRGRHRVRWIVVFALVLALAIYGGQPEIVLEILLALALFLLVLVGAPALHQGKPRLVLRPAGDVALATAAGFCLGAPLLLPGLQLSAHSIQVAIPYPPGKTPAALGSLFYIGQNSPYLLNVPLGLICLVLAVIGLWFRRRRPYVAALGVVALAMAAAALFAPLVDVLNVIPLLKEVEWSRNTLLLFFALSVLGGVGVDVVLHSRGKSAIPKWLAGGFALLVLGLLALVVFGGDNIVHVEAVARTRTLVWRFIEAGLGLIVAGALVAGDWRSTRHRQASDRRRRRLGSRTLAALALLASETVFLVVTGAAIWSSAGPTVLSPNEHYAMIEQAVGNALVGYAHAECFPGSPGIAESVNAVYGVHELELDDRLAPSEYLRAWKAATGSSAYERYDIYCPSVTSARFARLYGVQFVLEPREAPAPQGAVFDKYLGDTALYSIPGAAAATTTPLTSTGQIPGPDAPGAPVGIAQSKSGTWKLTTDSDVSSVLRLRLTDVPGWHATIDGRPLALDRFSGIMLQARIPPGRHTIELHYWPETFSLGIALALCAVAGLVLVPIVLSLRQRRLHRRQGEVVGVETTRHLAIDTTSM